MIHIWNHCTLQNRNFNFHRNWWFVHFHCWVPIRVWRVSVQPYSFSSGPIAYRMEYRKCMLQPHNTRFRSLRGWDVKYRQTAYLRISVPRNFSFPLGDRTYKLFEMPRKDSSLKRFSKIIMKWIWCLLSKYAASCSTNV